MNSYPASELPGAELVVEGLNTLTIEMLDQLVSNPANHLRQGSGGQEAGLHDKSASEKVRA